MFETTAIPGVLIYTPRVFTDPRGFFLESYNRDLWLQQGIETVFVQDNHSRSCANTVRGLHFQLPPAAQVKLVRVVRGSVWDVAVDIREGSPTLGKWVGVELTETNYKQLYIPAGMAHGFCVLSDEAELLYKTSHTYSPAHDRAIAWNDPQIGVPWPVESPLLSQRDQGAPSLAEYLQGTHFVYGQEM